MKNSILFVALLFVFGHVSAQEIPNSGFEEWESISNYEEPIAWNTANQYSSALGSSMVFADNEDPYEGNFSILLESKNLIIATVPAYASLGIIDINLFTLDYTIEGGVPFNTRPAHFHGYFKYQPQGNDSCLILAALFKNSNGQRDTIGGAYFSTHETINEWTAFSVDLLYFSDETPDSLNIFLISSASENPAAGTKLYIDNLTFEGSAAIDENESINLYAYYQANASDVIIRNKSQKLQKGIASLYTINGQLLRQQELTGEESRIHCNNLKNGIYILKVTGKEQSITYKIPIYK